MVGLEAKLAFLRQPASYPFPVSRVETVETHMSWVFLTERHAYKLKKPVNYGIPDFSTLEARHFFCDEEVRLNRRLAPAVYLASLSLSVDASGHLEIDGSGEAVDWLVAMRRLPAERMLDRAIRCGVASGKDMIRVANHLAAFYRTCLPVPVAPADYRGRFGRDIALCRETLAQPRFGLPTSDIDAAYDAQREALQRMAPLLDERVDGRHIVEGHGDLRAEHVCLEGNVAIIDCLEFSRQLRIADPLDELGFLALECERLNAPLLGDDLFRAYEAATGESGPAGLVHFYKSIRAGLRARLAIRHLDEEMFRCSPEWGRRAMQYLELAVSHARRA